jgi:hypothetical protein
VHVGPVLIVYIRCGAASRRVHVGPVLIDTPRRWGQNCNVRAPPTVAWVWLKCAAHCRVGLAEVRRASLRNMHLNLLAGVWMRLTMATTLGFFALIRWHQFAHEASHYYKVVPWVRFIQNTRRTWCASPLLHVTPTWVFDSFGHFVAPSCTLLHPLAPSCTLCCLRFKPLAKSDRTKRCRLVVVPT